MTRRGFGPPACLAAALLLVATVAYGQDKDKEAKANAGVAAYVAGEPITLAEVDAKALGTNMKLSQQVYDARSKALDDIILQKVFGPKAAEANQSVEQYIRARLAEKATPVTDADVEKFYNSNKARMRGKTLEQMSAQIRSYLAGQHQTDARDALVDEAKKEAGVKVLLEVPRVELAVAPNSPAEGGADAKVTIVEFSDFQ